MIKKLQKRGNSHALVLDKTMMEQLGISPETPLQLTIASGCLVVRPMTVGVGSEKLAASLQKIRQQPGYPEMLENLAR